MEWYSEPEYQESLRALWSEAETEVGECDVPGCGHLYEVGSSDDHCPECGVCWEHCTEHTPESVHSMHELLLTGDDFE